MKILLATNYQPPRPESGGIEFAALELRRCWEEAGHETTWLTSDIPPTQPAPQPRSIRIPAGNTFQKKWGIDIPLFNPLALPAISRTIREHDVVNTHSLTPGLTVAALHLALRQRKPVVVTQHVPVIKLSSALLNRFQKWVLCWNARWATRRGATLTFVSERVRDWFMENARLDAARIRMTPVGINQRDFRFVDAEERTRFQEKWQLPAAGLRALFVGRYEDKKGIHLVRELAERLPQVHFTLRGHGSIDVKAWGRPNVMTVGYLSPAELRELYGAHDLLILPSFGEGWPAVVPQAMACGLACLISEEAFAGYGKDRDMFLVRPREADAWVRAMEEAAAGRIALLREREQVAAYSRAAWDWEKTARIYLDLFAAGLQQAGR